MDSQRLRDETEGTKPVGSYAGAATPRDATAVGEPIDLVPGQAASDQFGSSSDPFGSAMDRDADETKAGGMTSKVDAGMGKAAEGIDKLVGVVRDKGDQFGQSSGAAGTVGSVATAAAAKLEGASQYLHGTDAERVMDDLEALIRRKPVESLLVAAGVGFVVAKALR